MKITMLGFPGSGKTGLMYSMASSLVAGGTDLDYVMVPYEEEQSSFDDNIIVLADYLQNAIVNTGSWPAGTSRTTVYPFSVEYQPDQRIITHFDWVDFRGGLLSNLFKNTHDQSEIDELNGLFFHLIESNAVVLLVNSLHLYHFKDRADQIKLYSGARTLNILLNRFNKRYPNRELNVLIVLTKTDSIGDDWRENNYKLLIEKGTEVFKPIVDMCYKNSNWNGGIVPVTVIGKRNVETIVTKKDVLNYPLDVPINVDHKIINVPESENVESILYFCLGFTLQQMRNIAKESIADYQRVIENSLEEAGHLNSILSFFSGHSSASEIARLSAEKKKNDEELLGQFESHIGPLINHLKDRVKIFE